MRIVYVVVLVIVVALLVSAQTPVPGVVNVSTTVTATAGASGDSNRITCVLTPGTPGSGAVGSACSVGSVLIQSSDNRPVPGVLNGWVGSVTVGNNSVTWLLKQPAAGGPITWEIAANGVMKTGTF